MFSHIIKKSNQKCFRVGWFPAGWFPAKDADLIAQENKWPMMYIEGGQVTRVASDNLKKLD